MVCLLYTSLLFVSDSLVELSGYSREELLSGGIEWPKKLFYSEEEFKHVFYHNGLADRSSKNLVEFKIKAKNGKTVYINMYGGLVDSPESVSYTHLDVYKRQTPFSGIQ